MKITAALIYLAVLLGALYGWLANIWSLVHMFTLNDQITPLMLGRILGIFAFPLGAVLGYF